MSAFSHFPFQLLFAAALSPLSSYTFFLFVRSWLSSFACLSFSPAFSSTSHLIVLLPSCHFLHRTALPFNFLLSVHGCPAVFLLFCYFFWFIFSFSLSEATWRTSLAHSSLSGRKPHPSFSGRNGGYDSHGRTHPGYTCALTCAHTHTPHSPSIFPTLVSTFNFPPMRCQEQPHYL